MDKTHPRQHPYVPSGFVMSHVVNPIIIRFGGPTLTVAGRRTGRLTGHTQAAAAATRRTFRLDDMVGPPLNWILLGEEWDVQIVLGQIGRPWKPVGASQGPPVAPAGFASFDRPGFAKIAFGLKVQPHGATSSILTMETRVALTDPGSLRRFIRYWVVVGPFVRPIDRMTLRLLAAELRRSTPSGTATRT